jgi:hypothetical protein
MGVVSLVELFIRATQSRFVTFVGAVFSLLFALKNTLLALAPTRLAEDVSSWIHHADLGATD